MKREDLELELKNLIVSSLDLEDINPQDIETDAPLFNDGLGLDSIDAMELGMALKKKYNLQLSSDTKEYREDFYSISTLVNFVSKQGNIVLE